MFGKRYRGRTYPCFCVAARPPSAIWHLHPPASRDASARAQQRLDSATATIASPIYAQEAVTKRTIISNCYACQSPNDFATSRGSWHVRSRRKTSCTSISEPVLRLTMSLYSRSRSICRASFLRLMDVKRETPGSTSYLQTTFFFAQRSHEGRRLSHYFTVR